MNLMNLVKNNAVMFTRKYRIFINKHPGANLVLTLSGAAFFEGRWLKEGEACFKVRRIIPMRFQHFAIFYFQITINNYHYGL